MRERPGMSGNLGPVWVMVRCDWLGGFPELSVYSSSIGPFLSPLLPSCLPATLTRSRAFPALESVRTLV